MPLGVNRGDLGALESGSRASTEPVSRLGPSGFDPERIAGRIKARDPYLVSYLLGWFGLGDPEPWGAAMSFALEVASGYGLIRGESDSTATPLGLAVADILHAGLANESALAAGSRRAKTPQAVECEASQSGGEAVTPTPSRESPNP